MTEQVKRYDAVHIRYEDNNIRYGEGCEVEMVTARDYDALHAEAEALRDQNRDLRIEADGWFSRVNGVEAKLEELRAQRNKMAQILRDLVPGCKWRIMRPRIDQALQEVDGGY